MAEDKMKIVVLKDGTIRTETDEVSPANHSNAESFMKMISRLTGGEVTRTHKPHAHRHEHTHDKTHEHQ